MFTDLTNDAIWRGLIVALIPYLAPVFASLITVVCMTIIAKKKSNALFIQSSLKIIKFMFGERLGDRADKLFDIWLLCLDKVQRGEWTSDEMLRQFFYAITELEAIALTGEEKVHITEITKSSVKLFNNENVKVASFRAYCVK